MEYIRAKTILARTKSTSWFGTDYTMNLYRGCNQGCIYCDSRSDCYQNPDFDQIKAKKDALSILQNELSKKPYPGVVGTGAMSDPYNSFERKENLSRNALMLLSAYSFGVCINTKSDLVVRDADLLQDLAKESSALVALTITTTDPHLASQIEPGAPSPQRRLQAIEHLSKAGVPTGILMMPVLPFVEDHPQNILQIIEKAAAYGARFIYPSFGMTLRKGNREYYYQNLDQLFPGLKERYENTYGLRYQCTSPKARNLWNLFAKTCQNAGLLYQMRDIIRLYKKEAPLWENTSFF